ncbi:MAG TPA: hypothetical protein VFY29_14560 [Terriglobia bacterium]|nr:hypothetical protein [Terriglobia bacterium]
MLKKSTFVLIAALFSASLLFGHGDPIVGTVTDVKNDNFTIKDTSNKPVMIMVSKDTKYIKDKKTVTKDELKVGARVVIDAHMDQKMNMYHAEEVEIGSAPPAAPAKK